MITSLKAEHYKVYEDFYKALKSDALAGDEKWPLANEAFEKYTTFLNKINGLVIDSQIELVDTLDIFESHPLGLVEEVGDEVIEKFKESQS